MLDPSPQRGLGASGAVPQVPVPPTVGPRSDGLVPRVDWDPLLARLAAAQHGVVARRQLLAAGMTAKAVDHRIRRGRLHVVHPGVYAVGHVLLSARGWWMAAVLGGGEGAVLSHLSAAALWGLVEHAPRKADVLVLRTAADRRWVRARRVRAIPGDHRSVCDGIPCTSVARTLLDLATVVDARRLDRALRRAEDLRLFDRFAIEDVLTARRAGTPALRAALTVLRRDAIEDRRTKSELELRFLELLRRHRFVLPATNATVETPWRNWEVDTIWWEQRVVIELDGWWTHLDRESFRRDHQRDADVFASGYLVARLSWEQVVDDPLPTVARLERLIPRLAPA